MTRHVQPDNAKVTAIRLKKTLFHFICRRELPACSQAYDVVVTQKSGISNIVVLLKNEVAPTSIVVHVTTHVGEVTAGMAKIILENSLNSTGTKK